MSGSVLALHGSCWALFERWFWTGKALLLAREERKYGKQLLLACFGQRGRLEIELCLKMIFCPYRNKNTCSFFAIVGE